MCVRVCVKGMHIPCARNTKNVLVFYLSALRMIRLSNSIISNRRNKRYITEKVYPSKIVNCFSRVEIIHNLCP